MKPRKNPGGSQSGDCLPGTGSSESVAVKSAEWRKLCLTTFVVTLAVVYQLYRTALSTGNFEGFWFSLAHTLIVGTGVLLALRKSS